MNRKGTLISLMENNAIQYGKSHGFTEAMTRRMMDAGMSVFSTPTPKPLRGTKFIKALIMRMRLQIAKPVVFNSEQAAIFLEHGFSHADSLEFRLPFRHTLLIFSSPLLTIFSGDRSAELEGLMVSQETGDKQTMLDACRRNGAEEGGFGDSMISALEKSEKKQLTLNNIHAIARAEDDRVLTFPCVWLSDSFDEFIVKTSDGDAEFIRRLATACIGYINCENIYLHKEGEVPEKVNRKREREGKKILEPYYVCRIRGVQYDSNGQPTGEGTHHGFRYDVRGHFRKLATGKTTWVRPHQRGLQNELYIPKTYVVEKGAKQVMP